MKATKLKTIKVEMKEGVAEEKEEEECNAWDGGAEEQEPSNIEVEKRVKVSEKKEEGKFEQPNIVFVQSKENSVKEIGNLNEWKNNNWNF